MGQGWGWKRLPRGRELRETGVPSSTLQCCQANWIDEAYSPRWPPGSPDGWLGLPLGQSYFHYFQHHRLLLGESGQHWGWGVTECKGLAEESGIITVSLTFGTGEVGSMGTFILP